MSFTPDHDPMVCGIWFEETCDDCKELWLKSKRIEEVPLGWICWWRDRLPEGDVLAQVELHLAIKAAERVHEPGRKRDKRKR